MKEDAPFLPRQLCFWLLPPPQRPSLFHCRHEWLQKPNDNCIVKRRRGGEVKRPHRIILKFRQELLLLDIFIVRSECSLPLLISQLQLGHRNKMHHEIVRCTGSRSHNSDDSGAGNYNTVWGENEREGGKWNVGYSRHGNRKQMSGCR